MDAQDAVLPDGNQPKRPASGLGPLYDSQWRERKQQWHNEYNHQAGKCRP